MTELLALYRCQPWGPERMEWMVAQFMALYANRTRTKNERPHKPREFVPDYVPPDPEDQDARFLSGFKLLAGK